MATLAEQIRAQGGDWNLAGIDRAAELADLLRRAGVSTLQPIVKVPSVIEHRPGGRWSEGNSADPNGTPPVWTPDPTYTITEAITRLRIGGVEVGFVGDANNDGSMSNESRALKFGDMVAWSARGEGNVAYHAATGPDGKVRIFPTHGSSSDLTRSLKNFLTAVTVIAGGVLLVGAVAPGAVAGAAGAEAGAAGAAGAAAGSGATNAALIESALQTAGYGASSAGLGGGAGVLAGAGATNAALIESALQTAGYGASSAGAGGGAGVLASAGAGAGSLLAEVGSAVGKVADQVLTSVAGQAITSTVDAAIGALLPAAPAPPPLPGVTPGAAGPGAAAGLPGGLLLAGAAVLLALFL